VGELAKSQPLQQTTIMNQKTRNQKNKKQKKTKEHKEQNLEKSENFTFSEKNC
jgi:hypothetical protein